MRRKHLSSHPHSFFRNYTYSKLLLLLLPLLIAITVVTATVFVYYPVSINTNWVNPPVRFKAVPGITTVLSNDDTTAVVDVTPVGGLVLDARHAFIYDDFSTDPFDSGRLTRNVPGVWSWNPAGYIQVSADGPSGSWGGEYVAYYSGSSYQVPSGTRLVYVISKERHITSSRDQYTGLLMIESDTRFYTLDYLRWSGAARRIEIWRYLTSWSRLSQTSQTLAENTWFIFLGRRDTLGAISLTVYDSGGTYLNAVSDTDTSLNVGLVGVGVRDESSDGNRLIGQFDDFVACADTNPRFVNVTQLQSGWTVRLEDSGGNPLTSWVTVDGGSVSLDVTTIPIVTNGYLHVRYANGSDVVRKQFSVIVGGDVYKCVSGLFNIRILDFINSDSKAYSASLKLEALNVVGHVNSMEIWMSSELSGSTSIVISNNVILVDETSTITLASGGTGSVYLTAIISPSSTAVLDLTFKYSLSGVEVYYPVRVTIHG